jgi:hypothetical protein
VYSEDDFLQDDDARGTLAISFTGIQAELLLAIVMKSSFSGKPQVIFVRPLDGKVQFVRRFQARFRL